MKWSRLQGTGDLPASRFGHTFNVGGKMRLAGIEPASFVRRYLIPTSYSLEVFAPPRGPRLIQSSSDRVLLPGPTGLQRLRVTFTCSIQGGSSRPAAHRLSMSPLSSTSPAHQPHAALPRTSCARHFWSQDVGMVPPYYQQDPRGTLRTLLPCQRCGER